LKKTFLFGRRDGLIKLPAVGETGCWF